MQNTQPDLVITTDSKQLPDMTSPESTPGTPMSPKQIRKERKEQERKEKKEKKEQETERKEQEKRMKQEKLEQRSPSFAASGKVPLTSPLASDEVQNSTTSSSDLKSALSSQDTQDKPEKRVSIAAADPSATPTSDAAPAGEAPSKPVEGESKPDKTSKRSIGQIAVDSLKVVGDAITGRRFSKSSEEPPAMPEDSVPTESEGPAPEEPAPQETPLAEYDLTNKSTLEEAFAAAFTVPLDHDAAQEKFTQAAADYYLTTATPLYDDFKALLKTNLTRNAIHRTSSFCQVFLSVTGYIHIFTETDIAGMITREFADATVGSKDPHRKFAEIVLSTEEFCGFHNNGFVTKFNELFSFRRAVVDQEDIDRCYVRNETLLQKIDLKRQDLAQVKSSRNDHRLEDGLARHAQINMKSEELRIDADERLAALRDA